MAKYPQYEIKVIYKCNLCDTEHTAIARAVGAELAAELGGGAPPGLTATKRCLELAKQNVVREFFKVHPKAKLGDFELDRLKADETMVLGDSEEDINRDTVGIPMIEAEVASIMDEIAIEEKKEVFLPSSEKKDAEALAEKTLSLTGEKKKLDFDKISADGIEVVIRKRLEELEVEEKELTTRLMLIQHEIKQIEAMIKATESVKKEEKMEGLKKE